MVLNHHEVALAVLRVHSPASVADDQHLAAQRLHDAHRQRDLFQRIAFIEMEAPFHGEDRLAGQPAADETAGVRFDGGVWEMRNFLIR